MNTQTSPTPLIAWDAPTTAKHVRTVRWYLISGSAMLSYAAYSFLTGDWSFAVTLLLVGGIYFLLRNAPTTLHHISIEEGGFSFDGTFTRWDDCQDFWIVHVPSHRELHIEKKNVRWGNHEIVIQTGSTDLDMLRAVLSQFLQERSGQRERLLDAVIRILKL